MRKYALLLSLFSMLALAVACGDDDGGGGGADAGDDVDANDTDSGPTTATCGIQINSSIAGLRAGQLVSFNGPDGSLIGTAITDVDGKASRDDCVTDTMLSIYRDQSFGIVIRIGGPTLITVAGVQPGDTVVVGSDLSGPPPPSGTLNVAVAADVSGLTPAPTFFDLLAGFLCSASTSPGANTLVVVSPICTNDAGGFEVVGYANGPGGIVGYSLGTAPFVPGEETPVTLGGWVSSPPPHFVNTSVSNPPITATFAQLELRHKRNGATLYPLPLPGQPLSGGPVEFVGPSSVPAAAMTTHELRLRVQHGGSVGPGPLPGPGPGPLPGPGPSGPTTTLALGATPAGAHAIDLLASMLPRLAAASVTDGESPDRPTVRWFADGNLSAADGIIVSMFYGPPDGRFNSWIVVTPNAGAGAFTLPSLPDALVEFAPQDGDEFTVTQALASEFDWLDYRTLINTEAQLLFMGGLEFDQSPASKLPIPPPGPTYMRRSTSLSGGIYFPGPI